MTVAKTAFAFVVIAYPIIVYVGLDYFDVRSIAYALIALALVRFLLVRRSDGAAPQMVHGNLVIAMLLLTGGAAIASNSVLWLQYYPVFINLVMLIVFVLSLVRPPCIVEQFARLKMPDLPEVGVSYTRKVTMVWCGFFVLNGTMALYTILDASMGFWALYNGVISYSLMGVLFVGEYFVRGRVQRHAREVLGVKGWG